MKEKLYIRPRPGQCAETREPGRRGGVKSDGRKSGRGRGARDERARGSERDAEGVEAKRSRVLPRANDIVTITVTTHPGAE